MGFMNYTLVGSDNAADMTVKVLKKQAAQLSSAVRLRANEYNTPGYVNVSMFIREILMSQADQIRIFAQDEYKELAKGCCQRLEIELNKKKSLDRDQQKEFKEHFNNIRSLIRSVAKFYKIIDV